MQNEKYDKLPLYVLICFTIITFISSRLLQIYFDNATIFIVYLISILVCFFYIFYLLKKKVLKFYYEYLILFFLLLIIFLKYYNIGTPSSNLFLIMLNFFVLVIISFFSQLNNFIYIFFNLFFKLNLFVLLSFVILPQFAILNFAPLIDDNNSINFLTIPRYIGTLTSPGQVVYISIAMFSYFLSHLGKKDISFSNKVLFSHIIISIIIGVFTLNRSFIVIVFLLLIYHFSSLNILKKIKLLLTLFLSFILLFLFFRNYLEGFFNIYINRFDQGFENRVSGESGIENTINLISKIPSLFGNLVYSDNGFFILYNGKYEQPHNGILYFIGAFGLIPFFLLFIIYLKSFLIMYNLYDFKKKLIKIQTLLYLIISTLLISLTEVFIFDIINVLIIFSIFSLNKKKYG